MSAVNNRLSEIENADQVGQPAPEQAGTGANVAHDESSAGSNGEAPGGNGRFDEPRETMTGVNGRKVPLARLMSQLSVPQHKALTLMAQGNTIPEAARKIGISRGTIYRWINSNAHFKAAYNAWQQEQRESGRAGLLSLVGTVVQSIRESIARNPELAFKVAKELRLFEEREEAMTTDPQLVEHEIGIRELRAELRLERQHLRAMLRKMGWSNEQIKHYGKSPKQLAEALAEGEDDEDEHGQDQEDEQESHTDEEGDFERDKGAAVARGLNLASMMQVLGKE